MINNNKLTGEKRARLIAFYLPQFHPIPENDKWWGNGFTEWTNVSKAKPLFKGHYQPQLPADLGFYDLRVPHVREAQAVLARTYGIEGFCYWHYWFGNGKRLLERVFDEVLESGQPNFPFCLGWANQTWTGIWHGLENRILIQQTYPGEKDYREHFQFLLKAFRDPRYIRVDGAPLFVIYRPEDLPDSKSVIDLWNRLAKENGFPGLYIAGVAGRHVPVIDLGFDARIPCEPAEFQNLSSTAITQRISRKFTKGLRLLKQKQEASGPVIFSYEEKANIFVQLPKCEPTVLPCVVPNWDNTPRCGERGTLFRDAHPSLYARVLRKAVADIADRPKDHRIVFIKSWNEWAEGNYLEPSQRFGIDYLKATLECLTDGQA